MLVWIAVADLGSSCSSHAAPRDFKGEKGWQATCMERNRSRSEEGKKVRKLGGENRIADAGVHQESLIFYVPAARSCKEFCQGEALLHSWRSRRTPQRRKRAMWLRL